MLNNKIHVVVNEEVENASNRQEQEDATNQGSLSVVYYLSILSGPLLACVCGSFLTLIPIHNILEEPNYWLEDFIYRILAGGAIATSQNAIRAECWSNFHFKKRLITYIWLIVIGHGLGICAFGAHFYIWIVHFGHSQPLPLGHFMVGTALVIAINTTIYFRYETHSL